MNTEAIKEKAKVLKALMELTKINKLITSFLPAFKDKTIPINDRNYLYGNFNIGGTVSGRLSSSKINLQQLPSSGSPYAKPVKETFVAPDGWLMVGIDYSSLEARIDALLTKDKNKLVVYTDGYDSHCFNAYGYFKDEMPDITKALEKAETATKFWIDKNGKYRCK